MQRKIKRNGNRGVIMYQRRSSCRKTYHSGGGIDWKRTIVHCAIFIVILSVIQMVLSMLGFGRSGLLILCLGIIIWYFGPGIWRNIKSSHRYKKANKRKEVNRYEILDLEE